MHTEPRTRAKAPPMRRNGRVALVLGALAASMVGVAFASVPLYQWFCKTTGFAGTTQVAVSLPNRVGTRDFEVLFDANVQGDVPWKFHPDQASVTLKAGEVRTVTYTFENPTDEDITATAVYNVTPDTVGAYFNKITCFCFSQQRLAPHEKVTQPVTFFIDPEIEADRVNNPVKSVTLSYTFFRIPNATPVASAKTNAPGS